MQQEAPLLHIFIEEIESLVRKLLLRFMDAGYVSTLFTLSEVCVDDNDNYLPLGEVFVGHSASVYLEEALEDWISSSEVKSFKETVRTWWYTASKEALKRLPLQDEFLLSLKWLQPGQNRYILLSQVLEVAKRLPQVIKPNEASKLQEEFMDFCTSPLSPKFNTVKEVDRSLIGQIRDITDTDFKYPVLSKLAKAILVIPLGNADTERLFSHVGLNKTKHRTSLSIETLNAFNLIPLVNAMNSGQCKI